VETVRFKLAVKNGQMDGWLQRQRYYSEVIYCRSLLPICFTRWTRSVSDSSLCCM